MRRLTAVLLFALSIVAVGCVSDDSHTLFVQGQAVVRNVEGACIPDEAEVVLQGQLNFFDVDPATGAGASTPRPYMLVPQVVNTVIDNTTDFTSDPNIAQPLSFEIEIRRFNGAALQFPGLPNPFSVPASGAVLDSRQGQMASASVLVGTGIPEAYSNALIPLTDSGATDLVVLHTNVNVRTLGENDIKSAEWVWPVAIYSDDVFRCATDNTEILCATGQDGAPVRLVYDNAQQQAEFASLCAGGGG